MARKPVDLAEVEQWLEHPMTEWFFEELLELFDPHHRILLTDSKDTVGEIKGEQKVMKFIMNPKELYDA